MGQEECTFMHSWNEVEKSVPKCKARKVLVPVGLSTSILEEVYPSEVEVSRCSGACPGFNAKSCIPDSKTTKEYTITVFDHLTNVVKCMKKKLLKIIQVVNVIVK